MESSTSTLEDEAARYERVADELRLAAAHCATTAAHYRAADVPRAAAHAWAASGHVELARRELADAAVAHASHSTTATD
jgi:hypothetical protein